MQLATAVKQHAPGRVSARMIRALQTEILARELVSAWHARHAGGDALFSLVGTSHQHSTHTLKRMLGILLGGLAWNEQKRIEIELDGAAADVRLVDQEI